MLRTNLARRPFYNERVVHLLIALGAVIVLAVTVMNVVKVVDLSRQNTSLSTRVRDQRAETARLTAEAARIRRGIDQADLTRVAAEAREANALIDQRTFSWTGFFNQIETTLPPDVMLVSVRPSVESGETRVSMVVLGRRTEDIDEFMEKLEATGAFERVQPRQVDSTDEGLDRAVVDAVYVPAAGDAGDAAAPERLDGAAPAGAEPGTPREKGARR
jgi:hypothetical protein